MTYSRNPTPYEPPLPSSYVIRRERSGIHGSGVYARIAIPTGYTIIEYRGERITKAESRRREQARLECLRRGINEPSYVFYLNNRYDLDARRYGNLSRYINHSCEPNCRAEQHRDRIWIVAGSDINENEELTFDYGFPYKDWDLNPCLCGTDSCPGYIVGKRQRWRVRRALTIAMSEVV